MTERNDIIQRIVNLRGLADSTASENEAMSALGVADKLMKAYRLSEAEIAMAEATGEVKVEIVSEFQSGINSGRNRHKVQQCVWAIEQYCEVEVVIKRRGEDVLHWIGDKPDVELAMYLVDMIRTAMDRAYNSWRRQQQGVGRGAKGTFQLAMACRIIERLKELARQRDKDRKVALLEAQAALSKDQAEALGVAVANGDIAELTDTALIVVAAAEVKKAAVQETFQTRYGQTRLGTASGFSYRGSRTAYDAGRSAGNSVNFGRPVGQSQAARLN